MTHHSLYWIGLILVLVQGTSAYCPNGKCGRHCRSSCIGTCDISGCNKTTCLCFACPDGNHGKECSLHCPRNCYSGENKRRLCDRSTGACSDGCVKGFCSPKAHCNIPCGKNCTDCDVDCKCTGCIAGHYGDSCECQHCFEMVTKCNITAMAIMTMAIFFVMIIVVVWARKHYLEKRPTNKDSDSPPGSPQIDPRFDRSIDVHYLTGAEGSDRYILAQLPSTKELDENFLRMVCDHDIKVIVFISSNGSRVFESYQGFWNIPGRKAECTKRDDHYELWTLTLSQNGTSTTTHLYHHCKWFSRENFCQFMKGVRKNAGYHKKPIVVCSSEGEDPKLVFCILDCLMDKNPPREGIVEELNECVKRVALERAELGNKGKNKRRLRECCEYVLPRDNDETHQEMQSGVNINVKQSFKRTICAIPPFCLFGLIVLPLSFVVIIVCAIIMFRDCYA